MVYDEWVGDVINISNEEAAFVGRHFFSEQTRFQTDEVESLPVDAALPHELDQEVVLALLAQYYSAERVHQLTLILFRCLRSLNHDGNRPLDRLAATRLQIPRHALLKPLRNLRR